MKATYVTVWDNGDETFRTSCEYNLQTNTVTDVESADVDGVELYYCDDEFIELPDGTEIKTFINGDYDLKVVNGQRED